MSEEILALLRHGPRTLEDLALQTGKSEMAIYSAIRRLNNDACVVVNVEKRRGTCKGRWALASEHHRVCAVYGCETRLSPSNKTPYCRRHLPDIAELIVLRTIEEWLQERKEAEHEQLALCFA